MPAVLWHSFMQGGLAKGRWGIGQNLRTAGVPPAPFRAGRMPAVLWHSFMQGGSAKGRWGTNALPFFDRRTCPLPRHWPIFRALGAGAGGSGGLSRHQPATG